MKNLAIALAILAAMLNASAACADGASDDAAVRNRVTCYPFGIDKIGRGDSEGGLTVWKECFAADFSFSAFIGRGEPTKCPGESCPFPKDMSPVEMRAAFAKKAFQG